MSPRRRHGDTWWGSHRAKIGWWLLAGLTTLALYLQWHNAQEAKRSRASSARQACVALDFSHTVLRSLVLSGQASATKFEPLYRRYHVPIPTKRSVEKQARSIPIYDCQIAYHRALHNATQVWVVDPHAPLPKSPRRP